MAKAPTATHKGSLRLVVQRDNADKRRVRNA
jgi:hypothetical protein